MCSSRNLGWLGLTLFAACGGRSPLVDAGDDAGAEEHVPCSEAIRIPEGTFTMGLAGPIPDFLIDDGFTDYCDSGHWGGTSFNGYPAHEVYVSEFLISRFEATARCYGECVDAGLCASKARGDFGPLPDDYLTAPEHADRPMVALSWRMAADYCAFRDGRLPTEAEWEKAARGPEGRAPDGDSIPCEQANIFSGSDQRCEIEEPPHLPAPIPDHPLDESSYRVRGVLGGAEEWVSDFYDLFYYQLGGPPWVDPRGPEQPRCPEHRYLLRGGGYYAVYSPLTDRGGADDCDEEDCYPLPGKEEGVRCAWDSPPKE